MSVFCHSDLAPQSTLGEIEADVEYSKPIIEQVNGLLEKMDIAETESELVDVHYQITNLMNSKLKGRKILFNGMSFEEAMKLIDEEYQKKLAIVRENTQRITMTEEQTRDIEKCLAVIEKSESAFAALNAYDKAKNHLKQYESAKGIIYKGMNYGQLFEAVYQMYVTKCKELHKN